MTIQNPPAVQNPPQERQVLPAEQNNQPEVQYQPQPQPQSYFGDLTLFETGQRIAALLCASDLVPQHFRENLPNTMIALEMAARTGSSPLAVMQSMYVVNGTPGWRATFIISAINACGRFSPLRFEMSGTGDDLTCRAWALERATGEKLVGPPISVATARASGWYARNKAWQTMTELMLTYRAATLFGRIYAADVLMGMQSTDELNDIPPSDRGASRSAPTKATSMRGQPGEAGRRSNDLPGFPDAATTPPGASRHPLDQPDPPEPPLSPAGWTTTDEPPVPETPPAEPAPPEPPASPVPDAAERNRAMQRFLLDLESKSGLSELEWWRERHEEELQRELGGPASDEYLAVIEDWMGKLETVKQRNKKK